MIRARQIEKRYGAFQAVWPLDLEVRAGEVFGFLGLNGAGKTTTLRMLGGVLPPTGGDIWIDGISLAKDPVEARRRMSFIPDRPYLYDKLTAREFLRFLAEIYSMPAAGLADRIDARLAEQLLIEQADALVESFSHGMKQRLTLAGALLTEPRLLIVDEPMVGLDPRGARQIKRVFRELAAEGRTVFLSTHTMEDAAEVCDRLAIVHKGRIAVIGTLAEIVAPGERLEDLFLRVTGTA
ncbi:MAG: ABC transporter ATP-binding protein [Pseudomonadota bacterium]|nr:ABC transporter ATP-binding protein [Pseudomonadota bacterium]